MPRFHFYPCHDIALLEQALADQPYLAQHGRMDETWEKVAVALCENSELVMPVTGRSCRDRFTTILNLFKASDMENLHRSGTEEEWDKRDRLLTEVAEQIRSRDSEKEELRLREVADREKGKQIQLDALRSLKQKQKRPDTADSDNGSGRDSPAATKPKRLNNERSELELLALKEKRRAEEAANERLRWQVEQTKAENERERLRNDKEKAANDSELERQRLLVEEEKVKLDRLRVEADIREREDQRKIQLNTSRAHLDFIATLADKLSKK